MSRYYSQEAADFSSKFIIHILHPDKTVTHRPVMVAGMRRHNPDTLKTLVRSLNEVWTLKELRELEGW